MPRIAVEPDIGTQNLSPFRTRRKTYADWKVERVRVAAMLAVSRSHPRQDSFTFPGCITDRTGQHLGKLTFLAYRGRTQHGKAIWLCRCDCDGNEREYLSWRVIRGKTRSCGCLRREKTADRGRHQESHWIVKMQEQLGVKTRYCTHGVDYWCLACDPEQRIRLRAMMHRVSKASGVPIDLTCFEDIHRRWWAAWTTQKVAIYKLTDPTGEPWEYRGAALDPEKRHSQHCQTGSTGPRAQEWLVGLRARGLKPIMTILDWVPRSQVAQVEQAWIAKCRQEKGASCLNSDRYLGYGFRPYAEMGKTKVPRPDYGICRTMGCGQSARSSHGRCRTCYLDREVIRDGIRTRLGLAESDQTPRTKGCGLCHDCRGPCLSGASRCNDCRERRRVNNADRPKWTPLQIQCPVCPTKVLQKSSTQIYCSKKCQMAKFKVQYPLSCAERGRLGAAKLKALGRCGAQGWSPAARVANGRTGGLKRQALARST